MLNIEIEPTQNERKPPALMYVGPKRHARFAGLAKEYNLPLVDLPDKCMDALEANLAERKQEA